MKLLTFSRRTAKEILRDPLNFGFGLGFPVILLLLLSAIQANIPVSLFEIQALTPGISVFGLSFLTLFSAVLISKDRGSSFLQRLYATPLTAQDFIFGYTLPLLPLALGQTAICYLVAIPLGLEITPRILLAMVANLPVALMYITLGLFFGSLLTDKQVGGICGALLTNLTAWLSGIWFDLDLVGGVFKQIAYALPFVHTVQMEQSILNGSKFDSELLVHLCYVLGYTIAITAASVWAFLHQMKKQ